MNRSPDRPNAESRHASAPLALVTGLGMWPARSTRFKRLTKVLSIQAARSLPYLVLVWLLVFIVIHLTLVFSTGLLSNLNHMYGTRGDTGWLGFWVFAVSVVVVAWVGATPVTLSHPRIVQRVGCALIGPGQRLLEHLDATPGEYTPTTSSVGSGTVASTPDSPEYQAPLDTEFADHRLRISGVAKWGGASMQSIRRRTLRLPTIHLDLRGFRGLATRRQRCEPPICPTPPPTTPTTLSPSDYSPPHSPTCE